jgi:hypothetical protein
MIQLSATSGAKEFQKKELTIRFWSDNVSLTPKEWL